MAAACSAAGMCLPPQPHVEVQDGRPDPARDLRPCACRPMPWLAAVLGSGLPNPMGLGDTTPRVLRFGVFELDRRSGERRREGLRVRLQEQPLRVLEALLDARGEPVTREALRQRLWPDETFVDFDSGLNRAINRLRAALGDEADNPRFIETLERRAYRFIAPVGAPEPAAPPAPEVAARPAPAEEVSSPPMPRHRRAMWLGAAFSAAALTALSIALAPALQRHSPPPRGTPIKS